jgi:hypothetical protein
VLVLYQIIYQVDLMCYSSSRILSHLNGPVVPLSDMQPYGLMLMLYSILGYIFLVSKGADISQFNLLYVTQ